MTNFLVVCVCVLKGGRTVFFKNVNVIELFQTKGIDMITKYSM